MASQWRALYSSQLVWLAFRAAYGLRDFCAVFPSSELYRVALREAPIWDAHSTTDGCDSKTGRHVLIFRDLFFVCLFRCFQQRLSFCAGLWTSSTCSFKH